MKTKISFLALFLLFTCSTAMSQSRNSNFRIESNYYMMDARSYKPLSYLFPMTAIVIRVRPVNPHVILKVDNGEISAIEMMEGFYLLRPAKLGKLRIGIYNSSDTANLKLISSSVFTVLDPPKVQLTVAGKKSGTITKNEILSDSVIHDSYEKIWAPYQFKINSFNVVLTPKGSNNPEVIPCKGEKIPDAVKTKIRDLPAGSTIYFEGITAKYYGSSGYTFANKEAYSEAARDLDSFGFTIADK